MTDRPLNFAYVDAAIIALNTASDYESLMRWWKEEKPNRDKYNLSPRQSPGLDLLEAFQSKCEALNPKRNVA